MCLPNILSPVFMFAFIFHCRTFSLCWGHVSQLLWIFMFFFLQNSSLLFSITCSRKKTRLCCCFFFLNVRAAMRFLSVAFGVPYLLIELFDIGMPVGRTDGRADRRSVYGHVITKFSRMGSLPHFLPMMLRCARFARESSTKKWF